MQSLLTSQNHRRKKARRARLHLLDDDSLQERGPARAAWSCLLACGVLAFIFPQRAKAAWNAVSSRIASRAAKIGPQQLFRKPTSPISMAR